jgi:hypothetical protein
MGEGAKVAAGEVDDLFQNVLDLKQATGVSTVAIRGVNRPAATMVLKERVLPARELIAAFDRHPAETYARHDLNAKARATAPQA